MTAISLGRWWPTDLLSSRNFPLQGSSPLRSLQHAFHLALVHPVWDILQSQPWCQSPPQGLQRTPQRTPRQIEMTHMSLCPAVTKRPRKAT